MDATKSTLLQPDLGLQLVAARDGRSAAERAAQAQRNRVDSLAKSQARLVEMMKDCQRHIHAEYDVHGLCRSFPERLQELIDLRPVVRRVKALRVDET